MLTIAKLFNFEGVAPKGKFGVEIETEGENLATQIPAEWRIENDGSLRGRFPDEKAEYVLAVPLSYAKTIQAIKGLAEAQKDAKLNFSFRTSVHVHMNVTEYTEDQLLNLIYVYYLLEKPLIRLCGGHREGNRFCLRMCDGDGIYDVLKDIITNGVTRLRMWSGEQIRYSALNLNAITKYGSVEFRGMQGTLDVPTLQGWLAIINNLGEYAKKKKDIVAVHNHFVGGTVKDFVKSVVGRECYEVMDYSGMESDVELGYSLTLDLPHFYKQAKGHV